MSKRNNEGDVVANRFNMMQANKQKLLASMLGPTPDSHLEGKNSKEDEDDDFKDENPGYEQCV
jgi:hypothetical protein